MEYVETLKATALRKRILLPAIATFVLLLSSIGGLVAKAAEAAPEVEAVEQSLIDRIEDPDLSRVLLQIENRLDWHERSQDGFQFYMGLFVGAFSILTTLIVIFFALNFRESAILAASNAAQDKTANVLKESKAELDQEILVLKGRLQTEVDRMLLHGRGMLDEFQKALLSDGRVNHLGRKRIRESLAKASKEAN